MDRLKKKRRIIVWGLIAIGWFIMLLRYLLIVRLKDDLVVKLHYSGYQAIDTVFFVASMVFFVAAVSLQTYCCVLTVRERKRDKELEEKAEPIRSEPILGTPEGIYRYLDKMRQCAENNFGSLHSTDNVDVSTRVHILLAQLDKMNEIQSKLEELLEMNNITSLDETKDLLQDIENAICMTNDRNLINYYVVGGWGSFIEHNEQISNENWSLLEQAQGLLDDIVEFVNGGKSLDQVKNRVDAFRSTVRSFLKEENE